MLPTPAKQIDAVQQGGKLFIVTVTDPQKRQSAATQLANYGRIEAMPNSANSFYFHALSTYTDDQIPALIDAINNLQL
mgnify:CR=1 FL=1